MSFQNLFKSVKQYYPNVQLKFKNESSFMQLIGKILFFNNKFMSEYTTTIGNTIYYPNQEFIDNKPMTSAIILLHELTHVNDSKKYGYLLFNVSYLFPQILSLLFFPFLFISLKLALFMLLFLLPLPAIFRMYYELKAYKTSLYVTSEIAKKYGYEVNLENNKNKYINKFKNSYYYFMWIFDSVDNELNDALNKINNNENPYQDDIFNIIDKLLENY